MPCYRCSKIQVDPSRHGAPWARGVIEGNLVLICPDCQAGHPDWVEKLDRCPDCSSTRLSVVLGSVVCRACGRDWPA
ncbi:MAG: hypothetical protein M3238_06625 [Actinomycetota bacterium]|nr:hypothetical protein [Actinomycetota bacterium]